MNACGHSLEVHDMNYMTKKESQMAEGAIFNIFISYSSDDLDKIRPILNQLSTIKGIKKFFAEKTINPGENISQTIIQSIKNSDIFIVFYSTSAIRSNYVQQEIGVAKSFNKIIIPILLDSSKPTGMLEGINYLNFYDPTKQQTEMDRLYRFIVQNVESKKQKQMLTVLGLLGLGYFLLRG
ncbi:MAG TPA: toll/interleukin-1 receptor domain-containing protein [Candidatus Bathyarchaeia archaeon]|nr:toll/interleukin-1 receptor domain-containing protein [Candidatus Bathyarchaeia archaeon]